MGGFRRVIGQQDPSSITTSSIAAQSIGAGKEKILVQSAYATLPPTAKYVPFTTAYGTPPVVSLSEPGSTSFRTKVGTYRADLLRVRPGSFQWAGTPSLNIHWQAFGLQA